MINKLLVLTLSILMIASLASADVIGVYRDGTGTSCLLAPGFNDNATVIHKYTYGSVGSNFDLVLPPGSAFFAFSTPYSPVPVTPGSISLGYGSCVVGNIVLGTIVAVLQPGTLQVVPATGGIGYVESIKCDFTSRYVYPSNASVGGANNPCIGPVANEATTWGSVKALYR